MMNIQDPTLARSYEHDDSVLPLDAFVRSISVNTEVGHMLLLGAGASISSRISDLRDFFRNSSKPKNQPLSASFYHGMRTMTPSLRDYEYGHQENEASSRIMISDKSWRL